jgi:outer membrane protein assembly factor BamB
MKHAMVVKLVLATIVASVLGINLALLAGCGGSNSEQGCKNRCNMLFDKDSNNPSYQDCLAACLGDDDDADDQNEGPVDEEFPIKLSVEIVPNSNKTSLSWEGPTDLTNVGGYNVIRDEEQIQQVALNETTSEDAPIYSGSYCYEICTHSVGAYTSICLQTSNRVCVEVETPIVWGYEAQDDIEIITANASNWVAAVTEENDILLLDSSGSLSWKYASDHPIVSVGIDNAGNLYTLSRTADSQRLLAFDSAGTVRWALDAPDTRGPLKIGGDGRVYYASTGDTGTDLNIIGSDGASQHVIHVADTGLSTALSHYNGNFYLGSLNYLYALDSEGSLNWSYPASHSLSTPAIERSDIVYIGANQDLIALNAANGNLLWSYHFDASLFNSKITASSDGTAFVSLAGVLHVIGSDGQLLWTYAADGSIGAPIVDDSGDVYLPCHDGRLLFFDQAGAIFWEQSHGSYLNIALSCEYMSGYGFYGGFPSSIYAIDRTHP